MICECCPNKSVGIFGKNNSPLCADCRDEQEFCKCGVKCVDCLLPTLIIEMVEQRGKCEDCSVKLSGDDEGDKCQDCQEQYDLLICGCCNQRVKQDGCGDMVNHGCCSDGACDQEPKIEILCGECGTWDEEEQVWRCPDCQEEAEEHVRNTEHSVRPCETCDKTAWRKSRGATKADDVFQKVHGCIVCQDCFEENKKEELPPGRVTLEMLLEHVKKLQKEDPKKYEELNAKFQKCA